MLKRLMLLTALLPTVSAADKNKSSGTLPVKFPKPQAGEPLRLAGRPLNLVPELQLQIKNYLRAKGDPIAAVMVADVATGDILALVQGREPGAWAGGQHTAVYEGFPAASIFKTVPTVAALEYATIDPDAPLRFWGGCSKVHARGYWLKADRPSRQRKMSLRKAYGDSCNTFYAMLAVRFLGVGMMTNVAETLRWGQEIDADFVVPPSPIHIPNPKTSSIQTVGKFSAGFGLVGMSVAHGLWITLAIARNGMATQLNLFADSQVPGLTRTTAVMEPATAEKLRSMMGKTVRSGTAASIFRQRQFRHLRYKAGGKTGTLTGERPKGLTTWFTGLFPIDKPEIAISAVVVNSNRWVIKGPHLAAETFRLWSRYQKKQKRHLSLQSRDGFNRM